jgi:uncharacterized protein
MKYFQKDNNYLVVLEKGEELFESLKSFLEQTQLETAWINGLGGCTEVELGFYDLSEKKYHWKIFSETLEITSLIGNITRGEGNEPLFHIHGNFANSDYQTIGGHVNKMIIGGTCELQLTPLKEGLTREMNEEIGLKLIK